MLMSFLGPLVVFYIGYRILTAPCVDLGLLERWKQWRQGKGWHRCPHTQRTTVLQEAPGSAIPTYHVTCASCDTTLLTYTEEDLRQAAAAAARWQWLRLTLRYGVLPPLRELARFCTFVGVLVVTLAFLCWLCWGTLWSDIGPSVIELGTSLRDHAGQGGN